jgi:hypothetical protein
LFVQDVNTNHNAETLQNIIHKTKSPVCIGNNNENKSKLDKKQAYNEKPPSKNDPQPLNFHGLS